MFIAPLLATRSPVPGIVSNDLIVAAGDPKHPARTRLDSLRRRLPTDKQDLDYSGWEADIRNLESWADSARQLDIAYFNVFYVSSFLIAFLLGTSLGSYAAIDFVERRFGRNSWNLIRYAEVYVPTIPAFVVVQWLVWQVWSLIFVDSYNRRNVIRDLPYSTTAVALAIGLAIFGYWSVARAWRWPSRTLGYCVWTMLIALFVVAFMSR